MRHRQDAEARLRPLAFALLEDGTAPGIDEPRDAEVMAAMLVRYSQRLRGDARAELAAYFERSGAVERELARLDDRRPWRRAAAAHTLGDMGSRRAIPALLGALGDLDRDVRAAAARSLGRLRADLAAEPLVKALVREEVPRGVAAHALLELGEAALPSLRGLALHDDPAVREAAVDLLGLLGGAGDASLVVVRLRDSAAEVRASAARALGRLAAEDAARHVQAALADRIPFVRAAAATALASIGDRGAAHDLLKVARTDRYEPAQAAARALARVDPASLLAAAKSGAGEHVAEAADRVAAGG
jgi:HEAT repeat protein